MWKQLGNEQGFFQIIRFFVHKCEEIELRVGQDARFYFEEKACKE